MYEIGLLIYSAAIVACCYLCWDAFQHRFMPIARPLLGAGLVIIVGGLTRCLLHLDAGFPPWALLVIRDIHLYLALPLLIPLWIWMLLEYHYDKVIQPFKNKFLLLFWIQPTIVMTLAVTDILSNGFLSALPAEGLELKDRLKGYQSVREVYGAIIILGLVLVMPYVVSKRQKSTLAGLLLAAFTIFVPYALHVLNRDGWLSLSLGFPALTFFIFWGRRQYRFLDVMPIALQGIMKNIDSGILVSDIRAKLLYANDYAQWLCGLDASTLALQQRKLKVPEVFEQHFDFTRPEKQVALIQTRTPGHDGEVRHINAILQPIFSARLKQHIGSTISLHDVTERRQAELELESYNRQKSEFFAGISHEFRTPLTLSLGNIDDVLTDLHTAPAKQLEAPLLQAKTNNQRLLGLVNQLLELSRLDKGSLAIRPVKLQLSRYLPMVIANFESMADKQNIQLRFTVSDKAQQDSTLYFDTDALDKVLINLISNALKSIAGDAGGEVSVTVDYTEDHQLQFSVCDSGCGIAPDALPHIFDMFYSHQMDNTAWPQSTGVGLSLVKQLLILHGADIDVSSTEGEGSCFTVRLVRGYAHFAEGTDIMHEAGWPDAAPVEPPLSGISLADESAAVSSENDGQTSSENNNPATGKGKPVVLLAEDNADMRRYIRKHLAAFKLIEAADGEQALELARRSMPDLVLSDVMMPRMNGYELCEQLKSGAQTSHIPVVLLTAKSGQSERLEGLSLGADDYLSKPFDVKELNLRINNLISARRTLRAFYKSNGLEEVINHPDLPERETTFLEKIQRYAQEHINNSEIKVSDLAAVVHMSERSLSRKLKALTGDTPKQMLMTIRLEQAAALLIRSTYNITQLSYEVGFTDASHFTRSFKKHYGMTPTEYRERHS